jgi:hypothetical protein
MPANPNKPRKWEYKPGNPRPYFRRNCDYCGIEYLADAMAKNPRFCSRQCSGKGRHPRKPAREGYIWCKGPCGRELPEDDFWLDNQSQTGRRDLCKECYSAAAKAAQTPESIARNRERSRRHYEANREHYREYKRAWCERNPDKLRQYWQRRRALIAGVPVGTVTKALEKAKSAYWGDVCWMCGSPDIAHMDHVKPFDKGGAHMICNLRPACEYCSLRKHAKWPFPTAAFCDPFGVSAD